MNDETVTDYLEQLSDERLDTLLFRVFTARHSAPATDRGVEVRDINDGPQWTTAINEVLREMWDRRIGSFSVVPRHEGFAVVAAGKVIVESNQCDYQLLEVYYINCIKGYSPYWQTNPRELPNQRYQWAFWMWPPERFLDVLIQKGVARIDFTFYVPLRSC